MTDIVLFIPDAALHDAVAEQIAAAKIGALRSADSTANLLKLVESEKPALVLLDAGKDDRKTVALVQNLSENPEKPALLTLGGDEDHDNVTENFAKHFRLGHLLTRMRYYLETAPLLRDRIITFGPYRLEPQNRRLLRDDNPEPIRLTEKETALLVFLAQCAEPASRRDILAAVWGYDERIDTHTLETHIYQLRRKLEGDGKEGGESWLIHEAGSYRLARGAA